MDEAVTTVGLQIHRLDHRVLDPQHHGRFKIDMTGEEAFVARG